MEARKQAICDALRAFIRQRPGFEPCNYDRAGYLADSRRATRDMHDALRLLREVELHDGITADMMLAAADGSGRLSIRIDMPSGMEACDADKVRIRVFVDWTAGQYWCVEFRPGTARYLSGLLWDWKREHGMPLREDGGRYDTFGPKPGGGLMSAGDWLRASFRREFGRSLADRYFS